MAGSGFWNAILFLAVSKGIVTTAIINPNHSLFKYMMLFVSIGNNFGVTRINAVVIKKDINIKIRKIKAGNVMAE